MFDDCNVDDSISVTMLWWVLACMVMDTLCALPDMASTVVWDVFQYVSTHHSRLHCAPNQLSLLMLLLLLLYLLVEVVEFSLSLFVTVTPNLTRYRSVNT